MIKKIVNNSLNKIGYHITKAPSLENKIKNGEYKWLQEFGINTVIDVGANIGGFALQISEILHDVKIYSFEPLLGCYNELKHNTNHIKNIKLFNYALGSSEGEFDFFANNFSPSSSFLKVKTQHIISFPQTSKTKVQKVQVKKLDSFVDDIVIKKKLLLKIDVQGYELEVLRGSDEILNSVDIIISEVSFVELYDKQPLFNEIYQLLLKKGFVYQGNYEQLYDPSTKRILQADAIFIKQ